MRLDSRAGCVRGFDMFRYDVCVIGGGILGCMVARELMKYRVKAVLAEKREDVCTGMTRANTAVVYAGYDHKPGTLKGKLCAEANQDFERMCRELEVPMKRCGSLMVCFGARGEQVLERKLADGRRNGVPGLAMLDGAAVLEMEPNLSPQVRKGLYAPTTGTVNPWELGIAAFENARDNGCEMRLGAEAVAIRRQGDGFEIELLENNTVSQVIWAKGIMNCAGLHADTVREMVFPPKIRIFTQRADYLVFDDQLQGFLNHVIFYEPEEKGKGLTLVPAVDGNILAGASKQGGEDRECFKTTPEGLAFLSKMCREAVPGLPMDQVIRNFGSIRPNPFEVEPDGRGGYQKKDRRIRSFVIEQERECPSMISLIGVKTPGLTCSGKLAEYTVRKLLDAIGMADWKNEAFCPKRRGIPKIAQMSFEQRRKQAKQNPDYGKIVCCCRKVTEGEIREAIRRGAVTVDGIKRRCGAGMGRCQGGRCEQRVVELLAEELSISPGQVKKDGPESFVFRSI